MDIPKRVLGIIGNREAMLSEGIIWVQRVQKIESTKFQNKFIKTQQIS